MKKTAVLFFGAALVLALALPGLAADKGPSGYMINMQGKKIMVIEFLKVLKKFPCAYKDAEINVPMKDIKSLTRQLDGSKIMIENIQGKKFIVVGEMGISYSDMMPFKFKDPISNTVQTDTIDPMELQQIVFDR